MSTSNEPGYYEDGNFGIRIENILICENAPTKFNFGDKKFLKFSNLTMAPLQRKLIDPTLLNSMEIITVKNVDEVLKVALTKPLKRVEWVEVDQLSKKEKLKKELSTH